MPGLERLAMQGFRRLRKIDLEMRPLMVMIGANNVGKTSFLDAVSLLAASANGQLGKTLSDMGGIANVLTRGYAEELYLGARIKVVDFPSTLKLYIKPSGQRYDVKGLVDENGEFKELRTVTSSTGAELVLIENIEPSYLRQILGSITHYRIPDAASPRAPIRLPQQLRPCDLPGNDGGDLVSLLYNLRENHRDRFEAIEDTLRVAFPGFESLSFPPVAAGMLSMIWKEKHFNKPLYMNELSSGTLRFLWLVSLLQSPGLTAATMIDEPEGSLHPELLNLLADLFREASHRTQLIVATQSDSLIRFLQPNEVVVMDIDDEGFAQAKWADTLDLDEWLKEYSLDELWHMGRIGARS